MLHRAVKLRDRIWVHTRFHAEALAQAIAELCDTAESRRALEAGIDSGEEGIEFGFVNDDGDWMGIAYESSRMNRVEALMEAKGLSWLFGEDLSG